MERQRKTGAAGARGRRGKRGATGHRGKTGKIGLQGLRGLRGPLHSDDVLNAVVAHFDDVYQELTELLHQIAKIQHQVDALIAQTGRSGSA
jgi:hypothetical protein